MSDFRQLSDRVLASPQIMPSDLGVAASMGVTLVINNRPDGEAPDQPAGADIEQAARAVGLDYLAIPIGQAGFALPQVQAMQNALATADGKVLAFCRSGTRSTFLWALAQAHTGVSPEAIAEAASAAGYDVSPIVPMLQALSQQSPD